MKNLDKIKKIIGIVIILLIVVIGIYAVFIVLPNKDKKVETKEVDKIKYGDMQYIQYNRDTRLYKEVFVDLKDILNKDSIDYEKYAEYISKLFIIDLYSLSNKNSKQDIGGVQYLKEELKENFILNASNTMYKYISLDSSELPEVKSIELVSIDKTEYSIKDTKYEAYNVSLKWEYKKDLGYDKEGKIVVIKDGEELYIVEKE